MKKNKFYFLYFILLTIFILIIIFSCKNNNLKRGILYSKSFSDIGFEASKEKAINEIYFYIANQTANLINRNDYNIVAFALKDDNLIDFEKDAIIKEYKNEDNFFTEIKVEDFNLYEKVVKSLEKMKREGFVGSKIRANASIEISEAARLNAYTRQILIQNALKRAYESLYKILLENGIDANKSAEFTNNAYIIEESYSSNDYNVVIETEIKIETNQ